jgi:putative ABC transport system permease protein
MQLRHAVRSLRRSPLTSGFIVATLAICIGAVAIVYSLADVVLVRGLPFDRPDRLLWVASLRTSGSEGPFSLPEFLDLRREVRTARLGGYASWSAILERPSGAVRLQGLRLTGDALTILGATPSLGRTLTLADDAPGAPRVVLLGYGYWQRAFAGDRGVLGQTLPLNGERYTVVGVLPRFFPLPVRDVDLVTPLDPDSDPRRNARNSVNFVRIFGRLEASASVATAARDLDRVAASLRERFPTEYAAKAGVRVTPLQTFLATTLRPTLIVLLACVGLMAAVALVNVLNLLLARATSRQVETGVRLALGASTPRIAVQLLAEGALLVAAAGILGTGLAAAGIGYARSHLGALAPRIDEASLSPGVLGVIVGVCGLAVLLFSLVPMWIAAGTSPQIVLRGAGRSSGARAGETRMRSVFVVAQVALALVIASSAAALLQSLVVLEQVNLGYRPDSVFVARLSLPPGPYSTPADLARFSSRLAAGLAESPGVVAAGGSTVAPLSGVYASVPFSPAEGGPPERRDWPSTTYQAVSPGYLAAVGVRWLSGRDVGAGDDAASLPVAVVNRTLAEQAFSQADPLGRELLIDDNNTGPRPVTIIGVVDDLREIDLDGPARPDLFIALTQVHPDATALLAANQFWAVRVAGSPDGFGQTFLRTLRQVDPAVATAGLADLGSFVSAALAPRRFSVGLVGGFTLIAVLLTVLGVYGVAAYMVEQRRREIGVRIALGATPESIVRLVLGRTLRLALTGVLAGAIVVWAAGGLMSHLMFGISPGRPFLLLLVGGALLGTALIASWLPGRRAARTDALQALTAD